MKCEFNVVKQYNTKIIKIYFCFIKLYIFAINSSNEKLSSKFQNYIRKLLNIIVTVTSNSNNTLLY